MSKKALVLLSGGMDSAVLLAYVVAAYGSRNVQTLSFNYGSKHNGAEFRNGVLPLCERYAVSNHRIPLDFIRDHFKSDLLKSGGNIPHGHYEEENMKATVVPFRNGIMLSIAAGFAESQEIGEVFLANHAGDHAIYPDCRQSFTDPMAQTIRMGTYAGVSLIRPFEKFTKAQLVSLGASLGVPFNHTYSCYEGDEIHCGRCGTCVERAEAFSEAGVHDPTRYKDTKFWKTVVEKRKTP
jgi:7-cyano-7-deazaguanine synthase